MTENLSWVFPTDPDGPKLLPGGVLLAPKTLTEVHFADNIPDLVALEMTGAVSISVTVDDTTIVDAVTLTPDSNRQIAIPVHQFARIIEAIARPESGTISLPSIGVYIQSTFGTTTYIFYMIPGGVAKRQDMFEFLLSNFLTAQPQILETTPDQPQWLAFVRPLPEDGNTAVEMNIQSVLYTADGRTFTKTVATTPDYYTYNQIDTSFPALWREFCQEKSIVPVAYDVFGTSAVSRSGTTNQEQNRPLGQRYVLRPARYNDLCFGFANSMGGFDTLLMQGPCVLKPDGKITTFVNNDVERELLNEYTSYWEASTGYIETERMAAQYQDFLKSANRWIYRGGEWLPIIVDEFKLEHTPRELNAYTFKYHLAHRNERRLPDRKELPEITLPILS